jgi:hypothetical protein
MKQQLSQVHSCRIDQRLFLQMCECECHSLGGKKAARGKIWMLVERALVRLSVGRRMLSLLETRCLQCASTWQPGSASSDASVSDQLYSKLAEDGCRQPSAVSASVRRPALFGSIRSGVCRPRIKAPILAVRMPSSPLLCSWTSGR